MFREFQSLGIICTCSPLENLTLDVRFDRSIICSSEEEDAILDLVYSIKVQIVSMTFVVVWQFFNSQPSSSLIVLKKVAQFDFLNFWQIAFHLSRHDHFFRVIFGVCLTFWRLQEKYCFAQFSFLYATNAERVKNLRKLRSWEFRNSAKKRVKSKGCVKFFKSADVKYTNKS